MLDKDALRFLPGPTAVASLWERQISPVRLHHRGSVQWLLFLCPLHPRCSVQNLHGLDLNQMALVAQLPHAEQGACGGQREHAGGPGRVDDRTSARDRHMGMRWWLTQPKGR